ncbi:MAG: lipoate--protein ligase family protein [Candidatus Magnetoovum sp. WYHC-5]|nr:lipoate--protein ligase family protein [Candidatus Magnetoovum sp. WYHC-5]
MAVDEVLAECVLAGKSPPVLRFYGWRNKSVTIGALQPIKDVDVELCNIEGIDIVRRPTGGRAILHGEELTYSFSSGRLDGIFTDKLLDNYKLLNGVFLDAFKRLGINAEISSRRLKKRDLMSSPLCFGSTSYSEITVDGNKVMGAAQKRFTGGFLQQGSIMLLPDRRLTAKIFRKSEDHMLGICEITPAITIDMLIVAIKDSFEDVFKIELYRDCLCYQEEAQARSLAQKYCSKEWNYLK